MKLRPYQARLINDLYRALNSGLQRIGLFAGTGSGKSFTAAKIVDDAVKSGKRVMFVVHLDVLVGQIAETMGDLGFPIGFIKAGWEENPEAPLQICSIQTLASRDWWKDYPADLIFFDEAHITLVSQIGKQLMYETHPDAIVIAMTATPKRLGHEQLGDHLEGFVASPVPSEIQAMGFLAPMRYFVPAMSPDLSGVELVNGDYELAQLKNACDRPELVARIVEDWCTHAYNLRTIAFCVDIQHAQHVAYAFWKRGIKSACVTGDTPVKERKRIYEALNAGDYKVLTSVEVVSIGFDVPSVECGLLLRPTESWALHMQQIGRVMRISPSTGKEFGIVLDQAGNVARLGKPEDITEYELPVSKEKGTKPAPKKFCPSCGKMHYTFTVDCECGFHWLVEYEINDNGLIELSANRVYEAEEVKERFRTYRRNAFIENRVPTLAEVKLAKDFGLSPIRDWYKGAIFSGSDWLADRYLEYLAAAANQLKKDDDWIVREFELEFGVAA